MSDTPNPYEPPGPDGRTDPTSDSWSPMFWPIMGFVIGTAALAMLVLSRDPATRILAGMPGGILGALLGLWYAMRRSRRR